MFSNCLRLVFGILFWLLFSIPANACSWPLPEGTTSDWVEDKVVFWGRAIETKWNKTNESGWHEFDNYTNIEVLDQVKGELPKKIKVYHSMRPAGCGIYYQLGDIRLFVIPKEKSGGSFRSSAPNEEAVSDLTITAYYEDGVDLPLKDARLFLRDSFDSPCKTSTLSSASKPDYCKWEKVLNQAKRSYTNKINQLQKASKKKWWQK